METAKIAKQIIDFQKTLFDSTYNAVTVMQDNSETVMNDFVKQFNSSNEEFNKPLNDSFDFIKKTRDDYKKAVDQGFDNLEKLVDAK